LLAYHDPNARVQGLDAVPPERRPPVNVVHVVFQRTVGIGTLLALLGLAFVAVRVRRRRLPKSRWFYQALIFARPALADRADIRVRMPAGSETMISSGASAPARSAPGSSQEQWRSSG
jgi:hypothetical protein